MKSEDQKKEEKKDKIADNKTNHIAIFFHDLIHLDTLSWTKILISNGLNIFFILLIFGLSMWMEQGNVFPIDLYNKETILISSINITIFHLLLIFLALIMSFYPNYIYTVIFTKNSNSWYIKYLGLIKYNDDKKDLTYEECHQKTIESFFRKYLGGFLFLIWSFILLRIYYKHPRGSIINNCFEQYDPLYNAPIVIIVAYLLIYIGYSWYTYLYLKKQEDCSPLKTINKSVEKINIDKSIENCINEEELFPNDNVVNKKLILISIAIVFFLILSLIILNAKFGWSPVIVIAEMLVCLILSFCFNYFRVNRKKYFGNDIYNYIGFYRYIGYIVMLFVILMNFSVIIAESINPLNIILSAIIVFYTVIIYIIKIYLFLMKKIKNKYGNCVSNKLKFGTKNKYFWLNKYHFTALLLILFCFFSYNIFHGNSLHELRKVTPFNNKINLKTFYESYVDCSDKEKSPIFYAAYGGGLKANYWNSLILDSLYEHEGFKNIVAFSGVSGGGMGIGNYSAGLYKDLNNLKRKTFIKDVKNSNILGIELPLLFFKDLIKEILPDALINGKDRSNRSMRFYADLLDDKEGRLVDSISFYDVYHKLFEQYEFYPNIIINSASTVNKYGVASAIGNNSTFPGAINILDFHHNDKSLTYYEAISTCNRFPFVSPAANIPQKGHFLDGGYYENSGIMSILSFKKALEKFEKSSKIKDESLFSNKVKLVSVRNDKMNYLESLLKRCFRTREVLNNYELLTTKDFSETVAVLSGTVSLEKHPNYLRDNLETYYNDEYELIFIDLPYYITDDEILDYFGGEPVGIDFIQHVVHKSNDAIAVLLDSTPNYNLIEWGIVSPPTSRLLSNPVEKYMEIMMKHPSVKRAIKKVYDD